MGGRLWLGSSISPWFFFSPSCRQLFRSAKSVATGSGPSLIRVSISISQAETSDDDFSTSGARLSHLVLLAHDPRPTLICFINGRRHSSVGRVRGHRARASRSLTLPPDFPTCGAFAGLKRLLWSLQLSETTAFLAHSISQKSFPLLRSTAAASA